MRNVEVREIQGYLGTRAAAEELAVSVGTVQKLVEDGHLEGWKTLGGHRRISKNSIDEFKKKNNIKYSKRHSVGGGVVIFSGVKDSNISVFDAISEKYADNFKFIKYSSLLEVLVSFRILEPLILIVDLNIGDAGDLEVIRMMCSMKSSSNVKCILFSGRDDRCLEKEAADIPGLHYLSKSINYEWLDGFFVSMLIY